MCVRFVTTTPAGMLIPLTGESTVKVCDRHREWACECFLSDGNLDAFAAGLARENLGCPHPANIVFEFLDPLTFPSFKHLLSPSRSP